MNDYIRRNNNNNNNNNSNNDNNNNDSSKSNSSKTVKKVFFRFCMSVSKLSRRTLKRRTELSSKRIAIHTSVSKLLFFVRNGGLRFLTRDKERRKGYFVPLLDCVYSTA